MDWYALVKFLHIACAVVWLGGGFTLMLLAVRADRAGNVDSMLQAMRATGELGNRLFAPLSLLTLAFGLILCGVWVGFSDLWVVIGLAGYAVTFSVGMLVFKPTADRMARIIARDGVTPAALAQGQRDVAQLLLRGRRRIRREAAGEDPELGGLELEHHGMALVLLGGAALALSNNARATRLAHA